jgi:hypothetical protein
VAKSTPARYVEFIPTGPARVLRLGRGRFSLEPRPDGTYLEAAVELGWDFPGVGPALDWIVGRIVDLDALRRHMREEAGHLESHLAATTG